MQRILSDNPFHRNLDNLLLMYETWIIYSLCFIIVSHEYLVLLA